jgi:hypothetical protein
VAEEGRAEHEDYHLALDLDERERMGEVNTAALPGGSSQPSRKRRGSDKGSKGKKGKGSSQLMDAFLKRARAGCS